MFILCLDSNNLKNSERGKHLVQEAFKRRTIYDIKKRYKTSLPAEDLPRSGRLTSFNRKTLKRLRNVYVNHIGISQQKRGKIFGVAQSIVYSNLKKIDLKYVKHRKALKYIHSQLEQVVKKCRQMRRPTPSLLWMMKNI